MTEKVADAAELRRAAMNWLARREYSRHEITQKLEKKFGEDVEAEPVLLWLEDKNFLNDERYVDIFLRMSVERGHGLLRIRQDLKRRGIDKHLLEEKIESLEVDWFEKASETRQRRFGVKPDPQNQKEKARQLRFLQYRGFTAEQCFNALSIDPE